MLKKKTKKIDQQIKRMLDKEGISTVKNIVVRFLISLFLVEKRTRRKCLIISLKKLHKKAPYSRFSKDRFLFVKNKIY